MSNQERFTAKTLHQTKPDGSVKVRKLQVPTAETKTMHRNVLHLLYSLGIPMPHASGAIPGKTLLDNVKPHRSSSHFYLTDLKDAFASVNIDRLLDIASGPVIPKRHQRVVREFITDYAVAPDTPGLPLGAPASPFLYNMYCLPTDRRIGELCGRQDIVYTRYLDDLTFSAHEKIGSKRRRILRDMIEDTPGMVVNHAKSKVHDLSVAPVTITGVSLYPDRRLAASPRILEAASRTFHDVRELAESGAFVLPEDVGSLHGYHGAIGQLTERQTPTIRRLNDEYLAALGSVSVALEQQLL